MYVKDMIYDSQKFVKRPLYGKTDRQKTKKGRGAPSAAPRSFPVRMKKYFLFFSCHHQKSGTLKICRAVSVRIIPLHFRKSDP